MNDEVSLYKNQAEKMQSYYEVLIRWITVKQANRSIVDYFFRKGFMRVGIYGARGIGMCIYDELKDSSLEIVGIIDKCADNMTIDDDVDLFAPDDNIPNMDVLVVAPVYCFNEIKTDMEKRVSCQIISIREVVSNV